MNARPVFWVALGGAALLWLLSQTTRGQSMTAKVVNVAADTAREVFGARGLRNNNPGNIVRTADRWRGMSADQSADGRFIVFDAPVWGLRAMARVLHKYIDGGTDTLREIIARWAPSTENDTAAYVAAVAQRTGLDPDMPLSADALPAIMQAIVQHENGSQPYAASLFTEAMQLERSA